MKNRFKLTLSILQENLKSNKSRFHQLEGHRWNHKAPQCPDYVKKLKRDIDNLEEAIKEIKKQFG